MILKDPVLKLLSVFKSWVLVAYKFIAYKKIRVMRMRFGTNFSREWENIRQLQKKSISNETASQEKQFKHIFKGENISNHDEQFKCIFNQLR